MTSISLIRDKNWKGQLYVINHNFVSNPYIMLHVTFEL